MSHENAEQIKQIEQEIVMLTTQLIEAKDSVAKWTETGKSLSLSAAQERAKNQGAGRGLLSAFLGTKFRSAMRTGAAASNASIAKDVAQKRALIAEGKRESQEKVRQIQSELTSAKQELKTFTTQFKVGISTKTTKIKSSHDSLVLLQKLKEAKDVGLLTEAEFEEKRAKLVADI